MLSPYLFALYIDDLIVELRQSGHGLHIGHLFVGCAVYADDIAILSASCSGLQQLINICALYGGKWDIKFNPLKSQLITFGGQNPRCQIVLNNNPVQWVDKVKYLGIYFMCNNGLNDVADLLRRFYSQFNNILSVIGKCSNEILKLYLVKTYCLPTLMYGCEIWSLCDKVSHKLNVAWNNCFRHVFSCSWRESVKPLQFFCHALPLSYLLDQRKLIFWNKLRTSENTVLLTLSRLVLDRFAATGNIYGMNSIHCSTSYIKNAVWSTFANNVCF